MEPQKDWVDAGRPEDDPLRPELQPATSRKSRQAAGLLGLAAHLAHVLESDAIAGVTRSKHRAARAGKFYGSANSKEARRRKKKKRKAARASRRRNR